MNDTLQTLMREATRLTQSGQLKEATAVIQRALGSAGRPPMPPAALPPEPATWNAPNATPIVLDGCVFEVGTANRKATNATAGAMFHGEFAEGSHTHASLTSSLTRRYKLYIPPGAADSRGKSLPLVVMLHGCTQNPDDFAVGTGMNEIAREKGFYVLYPAQSADANPQRCWNWFKHTHQSRGRGEAAFLADMTLSIVQQHGIDARRIYIAGLSAGGAMAAIVAAAYPDIYAAVGVHSGLAVGAASNVSEALAAMKTGARGKNAIDHVGSPIAVPTIVFHGDQDATVHPRNGEQVSAQALAAVPGGWTRHVEQGVSSQGRRFTRTVHKRSDEAQTDEDSGNGNGIGNGIGATHAAGGGVAEHWLVHGAGHAWSGGEAKGSYTDPKGPDASREMLRFFLAHSLPIS